MACERVNINVLVVDDDATSLAIVDNILNSLEYKVFTAKGAYNALKNLREFEGFFDLVITEINLSEMDGFEFQKRVNEFQIPVIMMSADKRKSVISKSIANGAAHCILKPFCADDFKDIRQYAMPARKRKLTIENIEKESQPGGNIFIQDVNSAASSNEKKRKRKCGQRKRDQMNKENNSEEGPQLEKKPKIFWRKDLHNLFVLAINQIGLDKAVPSTILKVMNVPNLTRDNVASHLQKYRMFLKKVAANGLIDGLSESMFASGLSSSVIKDFQERAAELHVPVQRYRKRLAHQIGHGGIANAVKPYNHVSRSTSYVTNTPITPLGRSHQFPYPWQRGTNVMLQNQHGGYLNQARLGVQSSFGVGTNAGANNIQQTMLGSHANPSCYEKNSYYNAGAVFPSNGTMRHDLMNSANGSRGGVECGDHQLMYPNYGSLGNHHNGKRNLNMGSLNNSNILPWTTSTYNPRSNIQLNGGSQMVGNGMKEGFNSTVGIVDSIANNNSLGLINNANKNVAPLEQGNFGLAQGGFAFASASSSSSSSVGNGWSNELPTALITDNGTRAENIPWNYQQLSQQLDGNVAENDNATMEDDFSDIFMMLDEMNLLIETGENPTANEFLKSDFSSSKDAVQSLDQLSNSVGDVIVIPSESTLDLPNESSDKKYNQDWDMDIIEALFGSQTNQME